jgi:glycosyltransferase involved in cell wall biosynthesis
LWREAKHLGVAARPRAQSIATEDDRARLHAAADAAIVPRKTPGGLPIKLLDALARGLPCVVTPSACAGLPLEGCVGLARGDDGEALASVLLELVQASEEERRVLAERGKSYVQEHHGTARFLASFDEVTALAQRRASAG